MDKAQSQHALSMQKAALKHIETYALSQREQAHSVIKNILQMSNIATFELQAAMHELVQHGRIAFHFHPDRIDSHGLSVAQGLLNDGVYKSQFETHTSNGHLSPELGGSRDHWENQLFGQAYSGIKHRPKYGALDLGLNPLGPAPRFGSCYLLSSPRLLTQASFTYLDSYRQPKEKGTLACFDLVLAALLSESFERQSALGRHSLTPRELMTCLQQLSDVSTTRDISHPHANLDHYIEAQVHHDISLATDIDMLVVDPIYADTATGDVMQNIASEYDIALHYHTGYAMLAANVPDDFRGPSMPELAARLAKNGQLSALQIGDEVSRLSRQASSWHERENHAKNLNDLKLLWHVLVKFGAVRSL